MNPLTILAVTLFVTVACVLASAWVLGLSWARVSSGMPAAAEAATPAAATPAAATSAAATSAAAKPAAPAHRGGDASCGLSADSALLIAMEVALLGRAGAGPAAPRLQTLQGIFPPHRGAGGLPQMDAVGSLLTSVFFPPVVTLPGGTFGAFMPHRFLGSFATKNAALFDVLAYTEAAVQKRPMHAAPPLRADGRSSAAVFAGMANGLTLLKPIEWSLIAICVARHKEELPSGVPATLPASYIVPGKLTLPRRMPPPEAIFSYFDEAKGAFLMFRMT
jgi:hypothetical protein